MPRVQVEATHLQNTNVQRVSLVKHNATRVPFRITKGDDDMIDFAKISQTLFRKAEGAPAVAAVIVSKSADLTKLLPVLKAAGLNVDTPVENEDATVFAQPGVEPGKASAILKMDGNVALVVSGLANTPVRTMKDFEGWNVESTKFTEVLATDGFFPAVWMAMDALMDTVWNIMDDADDASAASSMIGTAFDDAKTYLSSMLSAMPVQAFKADIAVKKASMHVGLEGGPVKNLFPAVTGSSESGLGSGNAPDNSGYEDPKKIGDNIVKADGGAEVSMVNADQGTPRPTGHGGKNPITDAGSAPIGSDVNPEQSPAESAQAGNRPTGHGGKNTQVTGTGEAPITDGTPEKSPVNIDQGMADGLIAMMKGQMQTLIDAQKADLQAFKDEVLTGLTTINERVAKAEEAVTGTALGGTQEDKPLRQRAQKSEGAPPLLDTAYANRNVA